MVPVRLSFSFRTNIRKVTARFSSYSVSNTYVNGSGALFQENDYESQLIQQNIGSFRSHCFWVRYRTDIHMHHAHAQTFVVTGVNPAVESFAQMEPSRGKRFLRNYHLKHMRVHYTHAPTRTAVLSTRIRICSERLCFQQMK